MDVKVDLDFPALAAMTKTLINERTRAIAAQAGDGYLGDVIWTDRPHGAVRAITAKAGRDNARHNTLLKAAFSGGGAR